MAFPMNGGKGETSYANNSLPQRGIIYKTKPFIEEVIRLFCSNPATMPKTMNIADLGCSLGPNSLVATTMISNAIHDSCSQFNRPMPDFHIFMNDLPENDFNTLFKDIPSVFDKMQAEKGDEFGSCFFSGTPGSFYGRLFPTESLHFVYSANSLHWLSKVPPRLNETDYINKGNISLGRNSPFCVFEAYLEQFRSDFLIFLKSRSVEIVPKGCMVLSFWTRRTIDPFIEESNHRWGMFAHALRDLVQEGIVEEAKMDSFNMPHYEPHMEEIRKVIEEEGSFDIIQLEEQSLESTLDISNSFNINTTVHKITNAARAAAGPILSNHFGAKIVDELLKRFEENTFKIFEKGLENEKVKRTSFLVVSLTRKAPES